MSKKLFRTVGKIAGVVAAVAGVVLAIPTAGASLGLTAAALGTLSTIAAISTVVGIGASLLAGKPKSPKIPPSNLDRLTASIDPRAPRKMVFGYTAMATDIRDQEFTGTQEYLHRFIVVASHKVQSIESIYFDDKLAWTVGGGAQGEFAGYLDVTPILEGNAGNAINISARMGTTRRYTGLAYVHIRYKLTGNTKKTESPFAQSIASRVTIIGKGWPTYDPRLDSTAGGSGSHRANNQATWTWDDNASRNPAIQLLNYYLGWKISGKLAVGKGMPPARIDMASFITGANICDELVALAAGGNQPRYRADGVLSESDPLELVNSNYSAAMNAELDDSDGKIRLTVLHNDLGSPIADFDDDDILGNVDWQQTAPLDESFNIIRGLYTDPSTNSLYQMVDYPQPTPITAPDGIDRILTFDLPMVQSSAQAQRLAKQHLQRQQYTGTLSFDGQASYWKVQKNDIIRQTFTALGFTNKLFRVVSITTRVNGVVPIVLREENAAIYAWSAEDSAAVTAAAPTVYDFTKNPLYVDTIAAAAGLALTPIGTQPPTILGNSIKAGATAAYEAFTRGQNIGGPCFVSCDINNTAGAYTMMALDGSATDKSGLNQEFYSHYQSSTGELYIYRNATAVFTGTITTGLTGKIVLHYDGVRYHVWIGGAEYAGDITAFPLMTANAGPLTHYPKWCPYTASQTLTGLAAGIATDNNFNSIGGSGKPDPYATSSDNLIANANLFIDSSQFSFSGAATVTRIGGSSGDPTAGIFNFAIGTPEADVYANNASRISINGASKLFLSAKTKRLTGNSAGTLGVGVDWYSATDAYLSSTLTDFTPPTVNAWTDFAKALTPVASAAKVNVYFYALNVAGGAIQLSAPRLAPTEKAADVTLLVTGTKSVNVAFDSAGAVKSGELPVDINFKLSAGGSTDVTTLASWAGVLKSGTATFTPTVGTPNSTGTLNVTALSTDAVIEMQATYNGSTRAGTATLLVKQDPPAAQAPSGGTMGSTSTITATTSSSYGAANTPVLTAVASGGQVNCTFPATFKRAGSSGTNGAYGKWQWRVVGGSFADITTEIASSLDCETVFGGTEPGKTPGVLTCNMTKTGLTNGTSYEFQLLLRNNAAATLNWTGTASVAGG